ncbi:MAG: PhoH family protein [Prevotellaceae bacterium]|jgi:phosphate starvation-inducible PhoH-like protein|nr:PhoH family protein [Prevotellaceae bacterium]
MAEKIIVLENVDPVSFYGVNNVYFNALVERFPKMKIVARGGELKIWGSKSEVDDFENKLINLIAYYHRRGRVTDEAITQLYHENATEVHDSAYDESTLVYGNNGSIIKARTANQKKLVALYESNDLLFAAGPAGSGKTYTAIALAVRALKNKEVKKIVLTRPAIEAGERLGFLPGDMKEKLDPYLQPLYDALHDMIPVKKLEKFMEDGVVQIAPLAFMRGRTLDHAFVILDEAQNATLAQMKMFLTRMGKNAKFIVTGDVTQVDLPHRNDSGLAKCMSMLGKIKGIGVVEFNRRDIIRHVLVGKIVQAFEKEEKMQPQPQ